MVKLFPGTLFLLVGNSGAGKDSIISGVIKKYSLNSIQIYAPKRYITRPPSEFEKNISVTPDQFREMDKKGKFAFKWHIYGLDYGISIEIEDYLKDGNAVIINVSRKIIKEVRQKYTNLKVVFIEVPFEITYERIKNRKRESVKLLKERIERARENQKYPDADFIIDNSGDLDNSINQFLNYLLETIDKQQDRKK